jgi:hypothetical protein
VGCALGLLKSSLISAEGMQKASLILDVSGRKNTTHEDEPIFILLRSDRERKILFAFGFLGYVVR